MAVTTGFVLAGFDGLPVLIAGLFVGYGFLGLVLPTSSVLALERHGAIAGTASALSGAISMISGAVVMAIGGQFADGTAHPMVATIGCAAILAWGIAMVALRRPKRDAALDAA